MGRLRAWWADYVTWRTTLSVFGVLLVAGCALVAIALSPLVLDRVGSERHDDWSLLSDVGQAYGAASAVLSGIAVIGVTLSLIAQNRQNRSAQSHAARSFQFELVKLEMGSSFQLDGTAIKRRLVNMWMNYAQMCFETGTLSQRALEQEFFPALFEDAEARAYWMQNRSHFRPGRDNGRHNRRFFRIADSALAAAVAKGPAVDGAYIPPPVTIPANGLLSTEESAGIPARSSTVALAFAAGALGGALSYAALHARRRHR